MEGPGLQGRFAYLRVRNAGSWLVGWSGLRVRLGTCESVGEAGVSVGVGCWLSGVRGWVIGGEGGCGSVGCLSELDGGG